MKHMVIKSFLAIVALAIFAAASNRFAYFFYTDEPINTRSISLGGSGTAYSTGGFSYYNPAAAATTDSSFLSIDFGRQWGELSRGSVETAWIFKKWFIGGSFFSQSINDIPIADETGVLGYGAALESRFSLLAGWKTDRYAVAAAANGHPWTIVDKYAFALSASGGITVSVFPGKLDIGAALINAGRYHKGFYDSTYSFHRDSMATSARAGFIWRDTVLTSLPVSLSADMVYSQSSEDIMVPIGIEVRPLNPLAIRIGKRFNSLTDLFSFGIGIFLDNVAFDAAIVPTSFEGDIGMKWLMGLRYSIPSKKSGIAEKKSPIIGDTAVVTPLSDPALTPALHKTPDSTAAQQKSAPAPALDSASVPDSMAQQTSIPQPDTTNAAVETPDTTRAAMPAIPAATETVPPTPDSTGLPANNREITPPATPADKESTEPESN